MSGTLYLVATPIGNLGDFSPRAAETLGAVDFIAAEDTRVSVKLLNHFQIKKPLVSYHEHNHAAAGQAILQRLLAGESCALVTDAGTPAISDPGEDLVRLCAENGVEVLSIPGCCAAVNALAVSGLPTGRFTFEGFITVYYEGVFSCYEEGDKGVSGINRALIDFYWKGGIVAPEFRRQTLSMQNPLFEKCTIYDGGARRYEIHEHIEEVLEFWNGILARADKIDKQALLEEKLGHALPISYEDWLKDCHYEKLDAKLTRWLYQQERGFVESLKDVTLEEIARQRIDEFTTTLKKYIL